MARWTYKVRLQLRSLFRRKSVEQELSEEVRFHLEKLVEENRAKGMGAEEARHAAMREFGGVEQVKEECRNARGVRLIETALQDLRYGLRQLRHHPGFAAVAILMLALGIGANAAIFGIFDAVLLRPLPFPHAQRLVRLWQSYGYPGNHIVVSYPDFVDWQAWNHTFSSMAAYAGWSCVLTGQGEPVHLDGMIASASLFQVYGIQPILGRRFLPLEDKPHADEGADAVILSFTTWKNVFHGDRGVIGQTITLAGRLFMVVGVAPRGVGSLTGDGRVQFWTTAAPLAEPSPRYPKPPSEERGMSFLSVVGRMKPGVTLARAQADMAHVSAELEHAYPKDDASEGVNIQGLHESMTGYVRPSLLILLAAVGIVLLIACANVAALLLARGVGRQREMAVRMALGATRRRIVGQLFAESLLLAAAGGAAGLCLAVAISSSLLKVLGMPWLAGPPLDGRVLGFAFLLTAASAVIFGLAPALRASRPNLEESLKEGSRSASEGLRSQRLRKLLVAGEVALATALLSSAGLLIHSVINLERTNPGFRPRHALTFPVSLPTRQYPQATWAPFFDELTARLGALPGVTSASAGSALPFDFREDRTTIVNVAGRPIPMSQRSGVVFVAVTPGYFQTLGIPIREGRAFTREDRTNSEPVVILNEAAARKYFGNVNPVGQQVEPAMWAGAGSTSEMRTVVGIVANVKYYTLAQPADPTVYWPIAQVPSNSAMYMVVRTAGNPSGVVGAMRAQLQSMDKSLPLYNVKPLGYYLDQTFVQTRYTTLLMGSFALLALILTAVGLYGSIAYSVAQRTHEIGIRMALGAEKGDVLGFVIGQGLRLALGGVAVGTAGALGLTRFLSSLLYGVKFFDPPTLAAVSLTLVVVATFACYVPARRATKVDPVVALRQE
jgi:putative ABC transport system permease protein